MLKTALWGAFLVSFGAVAMNASCIVEEGNRYSLECKPSEGNKDFRWITQNNMKKRKIQGCFIGESCKCESSRGLIGNYSATISCDTIVTSTLTIESVSRHSTQNDGTTWACETIDNSISPPLLVTVCDPLDIYAKPEEPGCVLKELRTGDTQLSMTCVTNKVFPEAKCQLYDNNDTRPLKLVASSITYNNSTTSTDPVYYKTTCTINIDVSTLGVGQHQLFVKMFSNVADGLNIAGKDSDIIPVNLSYPEIKVSSNCFNETNVKGNFIKTGTNSSCTCTMTNTGNPPGQIQWYRQGNSTPIGNMVSDTSVSFTITEGNTTAKQVYSCKVTSALTGKKETKNFTREFADGPNSVNLTGQNQFKLCLGEVENITVVCRVPKRAVNPKTVFKIYSRSEQRKQDKIDLNGNGTEQDEEGYFSYTYSFKPNDGGLYHLVCEAENSEFSDLTKTASHTMTIQAPPKTAPVIKINNQEITDSIVKVTEGESVTITCSVDGGYPPAIVTLNCSSLNESSVAETVASLTLVRFTREMDNQTCICTATHVSGCYQHNQTSVWLNVSLAEPGSEESTGLDATATAAAVGGGIAAAVIVIVLVILVICVLKRKGFLGNKKNENELILGQIASEEKKEETVTDNELYGTRPRSEEIVTENDIYGTQPAPEEVVVQNDIYGTGNIPQNGARDYSSFTPSVTSAATLPGNFEGTSSTNDHKERSTKNPYSDVAMPSTQPKPAVSAKPKTAIKPKTKYNNVNVSGEGAGPGFVIQGDNENQTYASVMKPAKTVSMRGPPKAASNNDEINGNFYPDQSKKPEIPEKKFLKVEKEEENEKKQREGKKALAYEDVGLPSTSDSNTSNINEGFTGVDDETNVYSNTETKEDGKDPKDKKDTGRYKNKDGLVYTQVDIGNQPGGQKTSRKPKIVEEGVNYTTLKFDEK